MTDRETAVEAMAKAAFEIYSKDNGSWELARPWPRDNFIEDASVQLDALLAHLTASGWQIVPVVATEGMCRAWENSTSEGVSFEGMNDEEVNNIIARMDYAAMLAAAPAFPGSEG